MYVVKESEEYFPCTQTGLHFNHRSVLPDTEEKRHQGITLFSFALLDLSRVSLLVFPWKCGGTRMELLFLHEDEKESAQDKCVNQPANLAQAQWASRNTSSTEGASAICYLGQCYLGQMLLRPILGQLSVRPIFFVTRFQKKMPTVT